MTRAEILYGTGETEPPARPCTAGLLSFELRNGQLRAIHFGGTEVLRGIQYLVRDRDWGTLAPTLSEVTVKGDGDSVRITYHAACTDADGARLEYDATIAASNAGLDFTVESIAQDDFTTSRLGFCVLHPAALAGSPLRVEHCDGSIEDSVFPVAVDPWPPFTGIRALIHERVGLHIACRLGGGTFEMEDQRNWSDASYKTYVRPLALPWPYVIPSGTRHRQSVRLAVTGVPSLRNVTVADSVSIVIGAPIGAMPRIGLVITPEEAAATQEQAAELARSGVQDLLLTFDAAAGHGAAEMAALARAVRGAPMRRTLECVLACAGDLDAELQAVADHAARAGIELDAIAVFPAPDLQSTPPGSVWPPCPPLEEVYAATRRAFPRLRLGGGMFGYFTELNRKRVPAGALDFVTHATCPIVHAADDLSVMQTLETVPAIMRSARAIVLDKPYRLGPITIGMRQNPYGSRTIPNPGNRRMPMARNDPRQDGQFAAAWTLGYAAGTEAAQLETLTLGALTGPLGIIGPRSPRPVFGTVAALAAMAGTPRRGCRTSAPDRVAAVCAGNTLLLANLTPEPVRSRLPDGREQVLDAYATARLACRT